MILTLWLRGNDRPRIVSHVASIRLIGPNEIEFRRFGEIFPERVENFIGFTITHH